MSITTSFKTISTKYSNVAFGSSPWIRLLSILQPRDSVAAAWKWCRACITLDSLMKEPVTMLSTTTWLIRDTAISQVVLIIRASSSGCIKNSSNNNAVRECSDSRSSSTSHLLRHHCATTLVSWAVDQHFRLLDRHGTQIHVPAMHDVFEIGKNQRAAEKRTLGYNRLQISWTRISWLIDQ